jgi:hypothetical protein
MSSRAGTTVRNFGTPTLPQISGQRPRTASNRKYEQAKKQLRAADLCSTVVILPNGTILPKFRQVQLFPNTIVSTRFDHGWGGSTSSVGAVAPGNFELYY